MHCPGFAPEQSSMCDVCVCLCVVVGTGEKSLDTMGLHSWKPRKEHTGVCMEFIILLSTLNFKMSATVCNKKIS